MGELVEFPVAKRGATTQEILAASTRRVMLGFHAHNTNILKLNAALKRDIEEGQKASFRSSPAWRK